MSGPWPWLFLVSLANEISPATPPGCTLTMNHFIEPEDKRVFFKQQSRRWIGNLRQHVTVLMAFASQTHTHALPSTSQ